MEADCVFGHANDVNDAKCVLTDVCVVASHRTFTPKNVSVVRNQQFAVE